MNNISLRDYKFKISDSSWGSFWISLEKSEWEPYTFDIFDKFLKKDKNYVDIGAWIGPTVLYGSQLCKKCIAIEPDRVAYKELTENIGINNLTNIDTFNIAIHNYDGKLTLGNDSNLGNSVTRLNQTKNLFEIDCYKLYTFFKKFNLENVNFIKMDVEGSEEFILENIEFFEDFKPTLYISLHSDWFIDFKLAMETIRRVGRLYKNCYDVYLNKVNINDNYGMFVFSDL